MPTLHAELIIHNGTIRTMEPQHPTAEAIAVTNGRILAVGALEDVEATAHANTRRLDLAGRTLLPGFNDAHVHLWKVGWQLTGMLDVQTLPSIQTIVEAFRARAGTAAEGAWLLGHGYHEAALTERRHPTRHDLDKASANHPIFLTHAHTLTAVANTRALQLAGISREIPDPVGGIVERDEHGEPTGVLQGAAMALVKRVQPSITDGEFEASVLAAAKLFLSMGITSVTEAGLNPDQINVYRQLVTDRRMPFRVNAMALRYGDDGKKVSLPERFESNWLRIDTVKLVADGSLSTGTAALSIPYRGEDRGQLRSTNDQMRAMIWDIHRAGLRAAIHAIGDAAIEQVIDAIDYASQRLVSRMKHRIEHFGLPTADQIRRCQHRIHIVTQPAFIHERGSAYLQVVPEMVRSRLYPLHSLVDAGLTVALSSDVPVVPSANPLLGLKAAAERLSVEGTPISPEQAVPVSETLPLYTLGGAAVAGEDHLKGSIAPGKYADFVVLSGDPVRAPVERLVDLRTELTIVNGQVVFSA